MLKKCSIPFLISIILWVSLINACNGNKENKQKPEKNNIIILYDNDVHCAVNGYAKVATIRKQYLSATPYVTLVSNGDFVSGMPLGAFSRGQYILRVMNAVGYDFVTLGNHEFDYQLPQLFKNVKTLNAATLCCNFKDKDGKTIFKPYRLQHYGDVCVAFIGVTTPSTIGSSSPAYFSDSEGNLIYSFCKDSIMKVVQSNIDEVRQQGADYVVVLSHMGDEEEYPTSIDMIANTHGIDVVLDGHSHSTIPCRMISNKNGDSVILTSTGTKLVNLGILTIDTLGRLSTRLIPTEEVESDAIINDTISQVKKAYESIGNRHVGKSGFEILSENKLGQRILRFEECPMGNLISDAFRVILDAEIGLVNGGGIRSKLPQGDILFNDVYSILPFGNKVMKVAVKGQEILDLLESAVSYAPMPAGQFPQVSGLRFNILGHKSNVEFDEKDIFVRVNGKRRVSNVEVWDVKNKKYVALDPQREYTIASTTYVFELMGCSYVFNDKKTIERPEMTDAEALAVYISKKMNGKIDDKYREAEGRITYR